MQKILLWILSLVIGFMVLVPIKTHAQILEPDSVLHKNRLYWVAGIEGSLWAASLVALNYAWYKDYNSGDFQTSIPNINTHLKNIFEECKTLDIEIQNNLKGLSYES